MSIGEARALRYEPTLRFQMLVDTDEAAICALAQRIFYAYGDHYDEILRALFSQGLATGFVAEWGGQLAGFAVITEFDHLAPGGGNVQDLTVLAVLPNMESRGIGSALLALVVDEARSDPHVSELRLTVAEGNERARRLFAHAGFQVWIRDHGTYAYGQKALKLRLPLHPPRLERPALH